MTKISQPANPVNIENTKSSIKASKVADQIAYKTKDESLEHCSQPLKPQSPANNGFQLPATDGAVAGFASSAFSCSLFSICKTDLTKS